MTLPVCKKSLSVFVLFFSMAFLNKAAAQRLFFIYGHALYAQPSGNNFGDATKGGIGGEVGAGIGWKKTFIVGTTGYTLFFNKDSYTSGNITYVPVKLGVRQYLVKKLVFLHADAGVGKIKISDESSSRFSGDFGAGVKFAGFELQLDYDGFASKSPEPSGYNSWIGFKAGFNIGF